MSNDILVVQTEDFVLLQDIEGASETVWTDDAASGFLLQIIESGPDPEGCSGAAQNLLLTRNISFLWGFLYSCKSDKDFRDFHLFWMFPSYTMGCKPTLCITSGGRR